MKSTKNRGILLGLGLLGATTFVGLATPAQARPGNKDVKEARKDVRKARKEVRKADSPEERRDAREDLRGEKRDLREERRENHNRPGYNRPTYNRPGYNRPGYNRPTYNRPGYNRPTYNRSGYQNGYNNSQTGRTVQGIVLNDLSGNDFTLRTNNGQTVRVLVPSGEPGSVSRGDTVRATGSYNGGTFVARSATVLRNR
ncbi:hypothetical protein B1R32_107107 [Abditibacterium utsteinense]|uniref:DUF5666 domain-containing protein n=1 Tax=Abditibacterium utsteinense TaxID=1960156 RepID=A0A2S8STF2_9BACT|nr:hypothetical protein [Abditibacterium utsteinense]PQV64082.1 hypothetical protein B1R32_107107 [Abditibacterium utsteinense]